jgi:hypothetical protein
MPICKRHAEMLPEPHKIRLWKERAPGKCGACDPHDDDVAYQRSDAWDMLYDLAIAMLLLIEFGNDSLPPACGCGAPAALRDDDGFCWGCGVADAEESYRVARLAIKKYNVRVGV